MVANRLHSLTVCLSDLLLTTGLNRHREQGQGTPANVGRVMWVLALLTGLDRREEVVCWYVNWEQGTGEAPSSQHCDHRCHAPHCRMACPFSNLGRGLTVGRLSENLEISVGPEFKAPQ